MLEMADEVQETLGRSYGMPELDDADLEAGCVLVMNHQYFECCLLFKFLF